MGSSLEAPRCNVLFLGGLSDITNAIVEFAQTADPHARVVTRVSRINYVSVRAVSFKYNLRDLSSSRFWGVYKNAIDVPILEEDLSFNLTLIETLPHTSWQAQQELLKESRRRIRLKVIVCNWREDIQDWLGAIGSDLLKDCFVITIRQQMSSITPSILAMFNQFSATIPILGFALPPVPPDARPGQLSQLTSTQRTLAMNAILKIISAEAHTSPELSVASTHSGFVSLFNQLKQALIFHHQQLITQSNKLSDELLARKLQISNIESQISDCIFSIHTANATILSLDNNDLVDLEVEGETTMTHFYRVMKPTPDFMFSLKTQHPIRDISFRMPATSKWEDSDAGYRARGTTTFMHRVKNKRRKDGYASVTLKGWRKEVYASNIQAAHATVKIETMRQQELELKLHEEHESIHPVIERLSHCTTASERCVADLTRMHDTQTYPWNQTWMVEAIRSQSVFAVSKVFDLTSKIASHDLGPTASEARSESLYHVKQLRESMQRNVEDLMKLHAITTNMTGEGFNPSKELQSIWTSSSGRTSEGNGVKTKEYFQNRARTASKDKQEAEISTEAANSLDTLEKSFTSYIDNETRLCNFLVQQNEDQLEEILRQRRETGEEISKAMHSAMREYQAANEILDLLESPTIPIGVFASLHRDRGVADAYLDLWRYFCHDID